MGREIYGYCLKKKSFMDDKLLNILTYSNKDIDNQKLMDYLSGKLSAEETHEIEKQMTDSDFVNDAVEGLEDVKNKKDLSLFVEQLNTNLHKQLDKKKKRKQKRALKDQPWLYFAIVLLLLFIIICFLVIKKHLDSEKELRKNLPSTEQK
jgi:anti-sigma factor RsiW